ncbi:DUF1275 domain-containing protein [Actinomadura sp. KC345]|uniref:YoaK family protein n=1 Tax=Actinomadura sp. KC345 TaxID=2530371 RepID=UPI00104999F8|nr:YoaK family protein [Actinomadura sp. KC345]TDC55752.1 DUF1275 domain-containing protein [Actinomadura sp. KC345]
MPEKRDHGPLPVFLIILTAITGLVDAVTYLAFGNVFVANMTGNVIFLGLRLGGSGETSGVLVATTISGVFFCVGAALGGRTALKRVMHRGLLLSVGAAVQACGLGAAALLVTVAGHSPAFERWALIPLLAAAMGWQVAIALRLAVPGLRTVVVTTAMASLVAERSQPKGQIAQRALSVTALMLGAMAGALLVGHLAVEAALWTGAAVLAAVAAGGYVTSRREGAESWG